MTAESEMRKAIAAKWWIPLIRGIAVLILGLLLLGQPAKTLAVMINVLGIYWLVSGLLDVVTAITGGAGRLRGGLLFGGVFSILAGVLMMERPIAASMLTTSFLVTLIALSAIISGVVQIFAGREESAGAGREWSWGSFFLGVLNVIFGVILLGNSLIVAATLLYIVAVWAIIKGIGLIFLAFRVRSLA
jgi:uncharacterized membrane protein HdeD (DUF308 family)